MQRLDGGSTQPLRVGVGVGLLDPKAIACSEVAPESDSTVRGEQWLRVRIEEYVPGACPAGAFTLRTPAQPEGLLAAPSSAER